MKKAISFLIVEDDKYARLNLREILHPYGVIEESSDLETARQKLASLVFDVVIIDIELGAASGADLIELIVKKGAHCIVVSSFECEETIEKAYLRGAKHYLSKHRLKEQLPIYVQKYINRLDERFEKIVKNEFITQDKGLLEDLKKLSEINWKNQTLFISGPTGVGKSLLGKLIHEITHPQANLVHLNCSEISESLLESELFGHEKGAFTGADQKKEGKLKLANGGTLFLDEVATMPLSMQQKLLKALDEKTFYPVGSSVPVRSDFTLITATCENIHEKMERKEFREDFYHRITGFQFRMKPLVERQEDIELLVKHFQKTSSRRFIIREEAMDLLRRHSWPGNIRELRNMCERFAHGSSGIIEKEMVQKILGLTLKKENPSTKIDDIFDKGLNSYIAQIEKRAVEEALKRNQGKITACIRDLKISSSAFYRILQEHQITT